MSRRLGCTSAIAPSHTTRLSGHKGMLVHTRRSIKTHKTTENAGCTFQACVSDHLEDIRSSQHNTKKHTAIRSYVSQRCARRCRGDAPERPRCRLRTINKMRKLCGPAMLHSEWGSTLHVREDSGGVRYDRHAAEAIKEKPFREIDVHDGLLRGRGRFQEVHPFPHRECVCVAPFALVGVGSGPRFRGPDSVARFWPPFLSYFNSAAPISWPFFGPDLGPIFGARKPISGRLYVRFLAARRAFPCASPRLIGGAGRRRPRRRSMRFRNRRSHCKSRRAKARATARAGARVGAIATARIKAKARARERES